MPRVVNHLASRPNQPVTLQQLTEALGVDPNRIQKALSNAINEGAYGTSIECLHRGQIWAWRTDGAPAAVATSPPVRSPQTPTQAAAPVAPEKPKGLAKGDVVEVIGATQTGEAVARDEDGQLYRVVPL